jgi:hypothetical protein
VGGWLHCCEVCGEVEKEGKREREREREREKAKGARHTDELSLVSHLLNKATSWEQAFNTRAFRGHFIPELQQSQDSNVTLGTRIKPWPALSCQSPGV